MSSPQPPQVVRPLAGKRALVTGASRGIGAAIARAFAVAGADVAISYSGSPDKAAEVVKSIESVGQRGFAIKADHAVQSEVTALVESAVKQLGGLDILVSNAGVFAAVNAADPTAHTPEAIAAIERMFAINVTSVATAVRAAAKHLPEGGRIITIGSAIGDGVPFAGAADYGGAKSALQSYTRGWARDFGPKGVTVNLIQPGPIATDMNPVDGPFAAYSKTIPVGRHGTVDELAPAVVFVASPAASFVTGSIWNIDGGASA